MNEEYRRGFADGWKAALETVPQRNFSPLQYSGTRYESVAGDPRCTCPPYSSEEDATWHMRNCPADPNSRIPRRQT